MPQMDLTNHFLIAMPSLADPNFTQTVTLVCAHSEDGAMGIVINRPLEMALEEVLTQLDLPTDNRAVAALPVFEGGPVHRDRGFVIHTPLTEFHSTICITELLGVSTSRDILESMSLGQGPKQALVALGYAGWGAGQLEEEMAQNAWLSLPARSEILFETPPELRWQQAAKGLGIDLNMLSPETGHA